MTKEELRNAIIALIQGYYALENESEEMVFQCGIEKGTAYCVDY